MEIMENIITMLANNKVVQLVVIAVVMDTIFGCGRAAREKKFNSSVGIDGAIRKISMVVSIALLGVVDVLVHINLFGFLPAGAKEWLATNMGIENVGLAAFFGLLYLAYEIVSVLKNMALCGLPVKGLWAKVRAILGKYTSELPDADGLEIKDEVTVEVTIEEKDDEEVKEE